MTMVERMSYNIHSKILSISLKIQRDNFWAWLKLTNEF